MSSSENGKKVFIVGPGFIGWNIIDLLVKENYSVTGLVRRKEHAQGIEKSGAIPILGDLNDSKLITEHAAQHDIIFHTATADHLPSVQAVLAGIQQRVARNLMTIYIHTSGGSMFDDKSLSDHKTETVFSDDDQNQIDFIADDAPHRTIDLAIKAVHEELGAKARIAIMIPPLIYGFNAEHNRVSIQIPTLARFALKHGYAPYINSGLGVISTIHVKDLARAYVVLLHHLEKTISVPSVSFSSSRASDVDVVLPEDLYYLCENTDDGEPSWKEIAQLITDALVEAKKLPANDESSSSGSSPKSVPLTSSDLTADLFGDFTAAVLALNSRCRARKLRAMGWEPVEKSWQKSFVEDELPAILAEGS